MGVRVAAGKLRGAENSRVKLAIARPGTAQPLRFVIERAHIVEQTVFASRKDGFVTLRVNGFNKDTALGVAENLRKARRELEATRVQREAELTEYAALTRQLQRQLAAAASGGAAQS